MVSQAFSNFVNSVCTGQVAGEYAWVYMDLFFFPAKTGMRTKQLNRIITFHCPLDMIQLISSMRSLGMSRLQSLGYLLRLLAVLSIIL